MKNFRMILLYSILCISLLQPAIADSNIEVIHVQGEVKVRKGLQETWIPAVSGMELKEIDTILSLE
jgi:hypothetical protein